MLFLLLLIETLRMTGNPDDPAMLFLREEIQKTNYLKIKRIK